MISWCWTLISWRWRLNSSLGMLRHFIAGVSSPFTPFFYRGVMKDTSECVEASNNAFAQVTRILKTLRLVRVFRFIMALRTLVPRRDEQNPTSSKSWHLYTVFVIFVRSTLGAETIRNQWLLSRHQRITWCLRSRPSSTPWSPSSGPWRYFCWLSSSLPYCRASGIWDMWIMWSVSYLKSTRNSRVAFMSIVSQVSMFFVDTSTLLMQIILAWSNRLSMHKSTSSWGNPLDFTLNLKGIAATSGWWKRSATTGGHWRIRICHRTLHGGSRLTLLHSLMQCSAFSWASQARFRKHEKLQPTDFSSGFQSNLFETWYQIDIP